MTKWRGRSPLGYRWLKTDPSTRFPDYDYELPSSVPGTDRCMMGRRRIRATTSEPGIETTTPRVLLGRCSNASPDLRSRLRFDRESLQVGSSRLFRKESRLGRQSLIDLDFEAIEMAARRQALRLAARALEQRLNADTSDYAGSELPCSCGAPANYRGRHEKTFESVLGPLRLERAYYHCAKYQTGFCPRDRAPAGVVFAHTRSPPHDSQYSGPGEL